jgi:hypothetical protein
MARGFGRSRTEEHLNGTNRPHYSEAAMVRLFGTKKVVIMQSGLRSHLGIGFFNGTGCTSDRFNQVTAPNAPNQEPEAANST